MNLEILSEKIRSRLVEIGYQKLTDIQSKVIPLVLEKRDVVAQSQTGTGKTAAFLIPIFQADFWKNQKGRSQPQVLVLEPTRELALQVNKEARKIAPVPNDLKIITVYGQESLYRQIQSLKQGADIVVGTLGRVEHHLRENNFQINNLKFLVLDEVDEMINEGFLPTTEWVIEKIPPSCQILLFSATVSPEVKNFAERFLKNPLFVVSQPAQLQVNNIQQFYVKVEANKNQTLVSLIETLNQNKPALTLLFVNTKRQTEIVSKIIRKKEALQQKGLVIDFLHGGLRQNKRIRILEKFRRKQISLLVVTDVLGRGIHVDNIDYVINYDIPQNPASYTHRIGRTGRAENKGVALTLVNPGIELKELLRIARRQKFEINEYKLTSRNN